MQKEMSFSFLTVFMQARLLAVDVQCHTAASLVAAHCAACVWVFEFVFLRVCIPQRKLALSDKQVILAYLGLLMRQSC